MKSLALLACALVACSSSTSGSSGSSHPTAGAAVRDTMNAYCSKLQACFPADFEKAFTDVQACVDVGVKKVTDPNAPEACTQTEVDTCVRDINEGACGATVSSTNLPTSCANC